METNLQAVDLFSQKEILSTNVQLCKNYDPFLDGHRILLKV